jgi:hypothetical protein
LSLGLVTQRLKLAAVNRRLMKLYRAGQRRNIVHPEKTACV